VSPCRPSSVSVCLLAHVPVDVRTAIGLHVNPVRCVTGHRCRQLDEGRRLVTGTVPAGTDISRPPTLEQMQSVVDRRTRPGYRLVDPRWLTYYHIHYRLAPHYRRGRTLLVSA
jgi:hypothetical protein